MTELVVNPEFLREGSGLYDFFHPDRIVVGGGSDRARQVLRDLYAPFLGSSQIDAADVDISRNVPLIETTVPSAQMIKYGSNAFLATRISFINEIASVCENVGADIKAVVQGLGLDPRIGPGYLNPGIGFGGPCLEKDLLALTSFSESHGYAPGFLESVLDRNDKQVGDVVERALELAGPAGRIAVLGLAFKAGTNDVRNSLSIRIILGLLEGGASVCASDPMSISASRGLLPEIDYEEDPYAAASGSDLALVLTNWPEYYDLDRDRLGNAMRNKAVLDGQNVFDPQAMLRAGFRYEAIGRAPVSP